MNMPQIRKQFVVQVRVTHRKSESCREGKLNKWMYIQDHLVSNPVESAPYNSQLSLLLANSPHWILVNCKIFRWIATYGVTSMLNWAETNTVRHGCDGCEADIEGRPVGQRSSRGLWFFSGDWRQPVNSVQLRSVIPSHTTHDWPCKNSDEHQQKYQNECIYW